LPGCRRGLAAGLAGIRAVLGLPAGDPPGRLHQHAIESINYQLRKVTKTRSQFTTD
jgi:hypothetical protein